MPVSEHPLISTKPARRKFNEGGGRGQGAGGRRGQGEGAGEEGEGGWGKGKAARPMQLAVFDRLGADEERLGEHLGAVRRRELAGVVIDVDEGDALGDLEALIRMAGERGLHEVGPDRQRRRRAAQAERLIVVEADPDDRQQLAA